MGSKAEVQRLFAAAGVHVNGNAPHDIAVHDERFYRRVLAGRSLALGESYMDGWWDCERLDTFFDKILSARLERHVSARLVLGALKASVLNLQSKGRARRSVQHHYDIGNDLYEAMLDETLTYSCGYWKDAETLADAQRAKYDLICRKIGLTEGMRVLDIGCGWGGFAMHAAREYGASVVGVTLSDNQHALAAERTAGLDVEIRLQDFREVDERFDRVVSIGMFEHVGPKNHRAFFRVARRCLPEDGVLLLHTIGRNTSGRGTDPWIERYIFPSGVVPSARQIAEASEGLFVLEDWHNFGPDYDRTLMEWDANFRRAWPALSGTYGERFRRMWEYYLSACAGSFRARKNQLWQVVLSPRGIRGGHTRVS